MEINSALAISLEHCIKCRDPEKDLKRQLKKTMMRNML